MCQAEIPGLYKQLALLLDVLRILPLRVGTSTGFSKRLQRHFYTGQPGNQHYSKGVTEGPLLLLLYRYLTTTVNVCSDETSNRSSVSACNTHTRVCDFAAADGVAIGLRRRERSAATTPLAFGRGVASFARYNLNRGCFTIIPSL